MSIEEEQGYWDSLTEGDRVLSLFIDRYEFTRLFVELLHQEPASQKFLFLYGDGGNGKSLLLRYLRQRCCKRVSAELWQQQRGRSDAALANYIEKLRPGEFIPVPAVLHDFGQSIGIDRPQDPFYGLLMLRRNLAEATAGLPYRLRFPLYDFACIWYLHKKGKSSQEIKSLFPLSDVSGALSTLIDAVSGNVFGAIAKAALDFVVEDLEEKVTLYLSRVGSPQPKIQEIQQQDVDTELIYNLPHLLAQDLNAAMSQRQAPKRIALFFDTHEAFWGQQKNLAETLFFERDEWLRRLLRVLKPENGIVVVIAGREPPRWADAGTVKQKTEIPPAYLTVKQVGHLATADAEVYLQRVGIADAALRQALIAYASVEPNQVHPLYLGLGADGVLQAASRNINLTATDFTTLPETANKSKVLIERLLKYVEPEIRYAVHALSACRAFNFELYRLLGRELDFQPTRPGFELLTRFSFVWRTQRQGQTWYRIHDLLRRLDDAERQETTQHAHAVMEQHYRDQGEPAEAIFHLNRLDWEQGVKAWVEAFDQALQYSRYEQCRILLEVRNELLIRSDFQLGRVSEAEADYFAQLAQYQEAIEEYCEAITAYDQALRQAPDDIYALNGKGNALSKLADVQVILSQHQQAIQSYADAITAYDQALQQAPDDIYALNNKGLALQSLANVQARLSQHAEAIQSYAVAIAVFDQALQQAPDYIYALNNKGSALQSLAIAQATLSQYQEALANLQAALALFNRSLQLAPNDEEVRNLRDQLQAFLDELNDG
jgi:tetratricopeptide (TPR) repeat protein